MTTQSEILNHPKTDKSEPRVCPFLGLGEDSGTWLSYPHHANFCHHAQPPGAINLTYQQSTCLSPRHSACPVFTQDWKGQLPNEIGSDFFYKNSSSRNYMPWVILGILLLVVLGAGIAWQLNLLPAASTPVVALVAVPTASPTPVPTAAPTEISYTLTPLPPMIEISTATPAPISNTTPTPAFTNTPTVTILTPGPRFEDRFGPDNRYLLHNMAEGESLGSLVAYYDTTAEVVMASNQTIEGASLWPGMVLLIVPGEKDASKVIRFLVIHLETQKKVADLAQEYGVSLEDIRLYNSLGPNESIPAGRYIIIPIIKK